MVSFGMCSNPWRDVISVVRADTRVLDRLLRLSTTSRHSFQLRLPLGFRFRTPLGRKDGLPSPDLHTIFIPFSLHRAVSFLIVLYTTSLLSPLIGVTMITIGSLLTLLFSLYLLFFFSFLYVL